jgi:hypothetical protein
VQAWATWTSEAATSHRQGGLDAALPSCRSERRRPRSFIVEISLEGVAYEDRSIAPLYERVPPKLYGGTERVVSYLSGRSAGNGRSFAPLTHSCTTA